MFLSFSLIYGILFSRSFLVFNFYVVRGVCLPCRARWGDAVPPGRAEGELAVWPCGHFVPQLPAVTRRLFSLPLPLSLPSAMWGQGLLPVQESARNVFTFLWSLSDPGEWLQAPGREDRPWRDIAMFLIALHTEGNGWAARSGRPVLWWLTGM